MIMVLDNTIAGVLFDWDGVLIDSLGATLNVYNRILRLIGMKPMSKRKFLELQTPNWYELYLRLGIPKTKWKEVDEAWVRLYAEERPTLQPDAMDCLNALKDRFRLALVSNGSKRRVQGELRKFGLGSLFEFVVLGESREELKPSPVMLERTLRVLSLPPSNVAYVGDAPADIQAAKKAHILSVAIARGPILAERLEREKPDLLFEGLEEMTRFLLKTDVLSP
jgi:HAD superfamily hydrolase (TIGR01509 family)